jgi:hypothetical protein
MPALPMFECERLSWKPHSRCWLNAQRDIVAQYRESRGDRRAALLVCEQWLDQALATLRSTLVVGYAGEKHLYGGRWHPEIIGQWTQLDAVAVRRRGKWRIGKRREQRR